MPKILHTEDDIKKLHCRLCDHHSTLGYTYDFPCCFILSSIVLQIFQYDILPAIFGSGKLCGIPVPYLQTGHGILLTISLLAALVYAPGNPLTEFPPEIRTFLKEGLVVTYSINIVLAVQAFFNARSKNLPALFWTVKTFLLGGIAYYEITQAKDPAKINERTGPDPSDRKSLRPKK